MLISGDVAGVRCLGVSLDQELSTPVSDERATDVGALETELGLAVRRIELPADIVPDSSADLAFEGFPLENHVEALTTPLIIPATSHNQHSQLKDQVVPYNPSTCYIECQEQVYLLALLNRDMHHENSMTDVRDITSLMPTHTQDEVALIEKAFEFALKAHKDHTRHSGEPYFTHLFETSKILAELNMGGVTIAAGLLHDVVEDQEVTIEEIEKEFGHEVAFIVDGVTKLGSIKYRGANKHNESLRKLFVATSEDIRVLIVKLADRLHNMRTLHHVPAEKQKRIATETLEIYAPIAYRLGIRKLNRELEDLAFPYVFPKEFEAMRKVLKEKHHNQEEALEKFVRSLKKALAKEGLVKIKTDFRVKGLYSLYKKLLRKEKDIDQIYDISAVRILVEKEEECYHVLGIIHANWRPLPGRIKDYIALPKPNGYRGIHTTVFTGEGHIVEVQIKTFDMHTYSEYGIASHIAYKGGTAEDKETIAWVNALLPKHPVEKKLTHTKDIPSWIKELVAYQESTSGHEAFTEGLQKDFFSHRIFVFSPKGDVVDLPTDSTPVDFAYSIHSDIGDHMTGAKVNGKLVSLDSKLKNGDIVEIMTKQSAQPNKKWLEYGRTSMARRHIRAALSKLNKSKR